MISPYHRSLLLVALAGVSMLDLSGCTKEIKDSAGNSYTVSSLAENNDRASVDDLIKVSNEVVKVQEQNKKILSKLEDLSKENKELKTAVEKLAAQRAQPTQQSYGR